MNSNELHPHTVYWLAVTFGLDTEPVWYKHRNKLVGAVHRLWNIRQECYYQQVDKAGYNDARRSLSMGFKIRYEHLDQLIGVCMTDPSNGYGCLRDFFSASEPKLTRTY